MQLPVLVIAASALLWLGLPAEGEKAPRRFLQLGPLRPFVRLLGMMGIPLVPLLLLRQLLVSGAAANTQASGGGAGMGSMGALGILAPFGAGAGLGGLRPAGGSLRPLGLRPLGNLIATGSSGPPAAGDALFLHKRSTEPKRSRFSPLLGALARLDSYDLSLADCQRRALCDLHRKSLDPAFGSLTEKLLQAFGVEARLERSRLAPATKTLLQDFLHAARNGMQQRDCAAIYFKCPEPKTPQH